MNGKDRYLQVRSFIIDHLDQFQCPPTIREIQNEFKLSSTCMVKADLDKLEQRGLIMRSANSARSIQVVGYEPRSTLIPFYGKIAAGKPIPVPDDPHAVARNVRVPVRWLPRGAGAFALQVSGRSMIDALVDDNSFILARSQPTVENGEMAVVEVLRPQELAGGTLKRFYLDNGKVELRPANPDYESTWVHPADVKVHGKVVAVFCHYEDVIEVEG